jgi:hypothetical protein
MVDRRCPSKQQNSSVDVFLNAPVRPPFRRCLPRGRPPHPQLHSFVPFPFFPTVIERALLRNEVTEPYPGVALNRGLSKFFIGAERAVAMPLNSGIFATIKDTAHTLNISICSNFSSLDDRIFMNEHGQSIALSVAVQDVLPLLGHSGCESLSCEGTRRNEERRENRDNDEQTDGSGRNFL